MARVGFVPVGDGMFAPAYVSVLPNPYAKAVRLEGDVKVRDRVALMFGYASLGAGVGVIAAMVSSAVQPALTPAIAAVSLIGALLIARRRSARHHWSATVLLAIMHLAAMAAAASMFLPELSAQILPIAGAFAVVMGVLAIAYGRWFATALNIALQGLLLSAPFGAAFAHSFFSGGS